LKFQYLFSKSNTNKSQKFLRFLTFISINTFIVSYFCIALPWLWTHNFSYIKKNDAQSAAINKILQPIVSLMGLEQNWGVFSPNVRTENHYNLVVITLQNGFLKLCEMPRLEKMDMLDKFKNERFRKLFNDNFSYNKASQLRPAFSHFLAHAAYSKYNPPIRIAYFLVTIPIEPPAGLFPSKIKKDKLPPEINNYFVYGVSPDDYK
jgi:hypothetical protein